MSNRYIDELKRERLTRLRNLAKCVSPDADIGLGEWMVVAADCREIADLSMKIAAMEIADREDAR